MATNVELRRIRYMLAQLPGIRQDRIELTGGVSFTTPVLHATPGLLSDALNWEVVTTPGGGYKRIDGYERYSDTVNPDSARYRALTLAPSTPGVYSPSVTRTLGLTGNLESSSTMRLAISDGNGYGLDTVGGGSMRFRTTDSAHSLLPDTFEIVYCGLNNAGNSLLIQTDQTMAFPFTVAINFKGFAALNGFVSSVLFNQFLPEVTHHGVQTASALLDLHVTHVLLRLFEGTTPRDVAVDFGNIYEVEIAPGLDAPEVGATVRAVAVSSGAVLGEEVVLAAMAREDGLADYAFSAETIPWDTLDFVGGVHRLEVSP